MNKINIRGMIRNIQYSHNIGDIEYYKAQLLVKRQNNTEDLLNVKFKRFSCPYKENDQISLTGNIRTYSRKLPDGSNKVDVYIFTYFDTSECDIDNCAQLDGRICKITNMRKTKSGKDVIDFIIANNVVSESGQVLNCYIPCVAWGKLAKEINKLKVGDLVNVAGELRSRQYKKQISENDYEIRIAHEINVSEIL